MKTDPNCDKCKHKYKVKYDQFLMCRALKEHCVIVEFSKECIEKFEEVK